MGENGEDYIAPELTKLGNILDVTFGSALWSCSYSGDDDDDDHRHGHHHHHGDD